ncbi:hypothetical protein [Anaerobutyricum hallii]|uniref:hypothetical protein n=1 Tax=Anaerobutyricum hallii TaxID=39488 RepID=UPI00399105C2
MAHGFYPTIRRYFFHNHLVHGKRGKAEVNHQDKGNGKQVQGIEGKVPFQIF